MEIWKTCPDCKGTGILNYNEFGEAIYCQTCGGSGEIVKN